MLIIRAFVNERQIDEIHVQNTKHIERDLYEYTIRKPDGDWPKIRHYRSDGWRLLALKVLDILDRLE